VADRARGRNDNCDPSDHGCTVLPHYNTALRRAEVQRLSLTIGTKLGPYEIVGVLGAGGMGEVYRGHDARLGRDVAIKILRSAVADDPDRLDRFHREARVLASLNHVNIAHVHGLEESAGVRALVMELVEGPTLAERIACGPIPIDEALALARQIAEALEAAHEKGIVHRDLKPANIKIRRDGTVKVLDFGLAKAGAGDAPSPDLTQSPTRIDATADGALVGTAPYMSPEQARGKPVDKRTDIWAFGCLFYEMLTGRRACRGDTVSDAIAAILEREPEWAALPAATPAGIRRLLQRCLEKDQKRRTQDIGDARIEIDDAMTRAGTPSAGRRARATRPWLAALLGVLVIAAGAAGAAWYWRAQGAAAGIDSVAVLPFTNQNNDHETEYLSDGLTESIINNLAQLADLRVIARNSAFRYKGQESEQLAAGKQLGVRAIVVGRVLQRGQNLVVGVELVDVRDNKQLWGQQYSRTLSDVFALQEQIAKEISEKLRVKLTGAERQQLAKRPTENIKALQYYMQGRSRAQRRTREDLLAAIEYCEKAIAEDRNYALAYTGLAEAYVVLGARGYITPQDGRRKSEEAAREALALDPNLAESHFATSQSHLMFPPYDFPLTERELRRAVELSPGLAIAYNYFGLSYARQGRFDESSAAYLKARELDPLSLISARASLIPVLFKRDYARARDGLRQTRELGPAFVVPFEIGVYIQNGLFDEALKELEQARQTRANDPILIYSTGLVYAAQGKRAEALQTVRELEQMSGESLSQAHWIAKVYAGLNEKTLALTWLERGLAIRAIGDFFKDEPVWDPIRADPRFTDLVRRMGHAG
jgi:eukaryotic-like serine/threonine-protein kinase